MIIRAYSKYSKAIKLLYIENLSRFNFLAKFLQKVISFVYTSVSINYNIMGVQNGYKF